MYRTLCRNEMPQCGPRVANRSLTFQETPYKTSGGPPHRFAPAPTARSRPDRRRRWTESSGATKDESSLGWAHRTRLHSQLAPEKARAGAHRTDHFVMLAFGSSCEGFWVRPEHRAVSALTGGRRGLTSPSRCGFGLDTGPPGLRRYPSTRRSGDLARRSFGSRSASVLPQREAPRGFGRGARAGRTAPRKDGQAPAAHRFRFPASETFAGPRWQRREVIEGSVAASAACSR
jgi:hypothetical protein